MPRTSEDLRIYRISFFLLDIFLIIIGECLECLSCRANDELHYLSPKSGDCYTGEGKKVQCPNPTDECFESAFQMTLNANPGTYYTISLYSNPGT